MANKGDISEVAPLYLPIGLKTQVNSAVTCYGAAYCVLLRYVNEVPVVVVEK
jgi:hypothetical protein